MPDAHPSRPDRAEWCSGGVSLPWRLMSELLMRRADAADRPSIIALCRSTLGWTPEDPDEDFFAWKHDNNPFGASPAWVAVADDGDVVGVRVFMRWGFLDRAGRWLSAVRAVDTATSPAWQGQGIFSRLTLGALPELRDDGVNFVFNTPNDKSRPGYLKMGWGTVGRLPVAMRPTRPSSLPAALTARTPAERWSEPTPIGLDPADAFADSGMIEALVAESDLDSGGAARMRTARSAAYLRWRYSFPQLRYRVVPVGDDLSDGLLVVRLRRRGGALECVVCDRLIPDRARMQVPWSELARSTGCDYLLAIGGGSIADRFIPVPRSGPILTWKPLVRTGVPSIHELALNMGDVELL